MESKRERSKNFTEKEKEIALSIIERFRPVLENKASDNTSLRSKRNTWEKVAEEFNAIFTSAPRNAQQIKTLWLNLRRMAKKTVAEENKNVSLVGSQYRTQLSDVEATVLAMVEAGGKPSGNIYNDNNIYRGDLRQSSSREETSATSSPTSELDPEPLAFSPDITLEISGQLDASQTDTRKTTAKQRIKRLKKKTTVELKRALYLRHIRLADMEINFKRKMYTLELEIKQKELERLC